jgi:hypothetical protein
MALPVVYTGETVTRSRIRGLVLLVALVGAQLATVGAALAGEPSCLCDANMCVHHPGQDHSRHQHQSHDAAAAKTAAAPAHCHEDAAVAPPQCSMRGCESEHEQLIPFTPLASLPEPTAIVAADSMSAAAVFVARPLLDRASTVEPPPPRTPLV